MAANLRMVSCAMLTAEYRICSFEFKRKFGIIEMIDGRYAHFLFSDVTF